jgi:hypothetical protein
MRRTSETVTIEGEQATALSPEGTTAKLPLDRFLKAAFPRRMDSAGVVLPQGTALIYSSGRYTAWVVERPPYVYPFRWIAPDSASRFGPGTSYRTVRIGLPYLVVLAIFDGDALTGANECFFRTAPIDSEEDSLSYPALLNCSRFQVPDGHPLSWICTQKLDRAAIAGEGPNARMRSGLQALMHCLLESGFNESSEHHEASSWFSESRRVDPRIASVDAWQEATTADPLFVLEVPWLATGLTIRQVVERGLRNQPGSAHVVGSVADLARIIFNQGS